MVEAEQKSRVGLLLARLERHTHKDAVLFRLSRSTRTLGTIGVPCAARIVRHTLSTPFVFCGKMGDILLLLLPGTAVYGNIVQLKTKRGVI